MTTTTDTTTTDTTTTAHRSRPDRLFCGCYPTGYVYADREQEEHGDYRRLAYINYGTLELDMEDNVPPECEAAIKADHEYMLANIGQRVSIAGNASVELGCERWLLPGGRVFCFGQEWTIQKRVYYDLYDLIDDDGNERKMVTKVIFKKPPVD